MKSLVLENRELVSISGVDAQPLLQDVISCGVEDLPNGLARPGALLTPQGKIMFAFLLSRDGEEGFLFDMTRGQAADFVKRMTMYRLRAKADIATVNDRSVSAAWDCEAQDGLKKDDRFRSGNAVFRHYGQSLPETATLAEYDRLRIDNGVAEAGTDYALSDVFPHDVLLDLNDGISFKKGCFVGQEVVSRMQHRGTARRRVVILSADAPLPAPGTALTAGGRNIGTLGTVAQNKGLALARIDKISAAVEANESLLAGDVAVTAALPAWSGLSFPATKTTRES